MSASKCVICDGARPSSLASSTAAASSSSSRGAISGLPVEFVSARKVLEDGHIFEDIIPSNNLSQGDHNEDKKSVSSSTATASSSSSSNGSSDGSNESYACSACTFVNPSTARSCAICGERNPAAAARGGGRPLASVISDSTAMMKPSDDELLHDAKDATQAIPLLTATVIVRTQPVITIPRRVHMARLVTLVDRMLYHFHPHYHHNI
jgi:hypothetical protein